MRKIAARIQRVNGGVSSITKSMSKKYKQAGRALSDEELRLIKESMAIQEKVPFDYRVVRPE